MADQVERLREALAARYSIEGEIGSGGMGTVYLASDLTNRRKVAIKVLKTDLGDRGAADRFQREIEIVANLAHPHILPLHDSGKVDELRWFASPWVEGESLHDRLEREGALPLDEAVRIAMQVADALAFAHERALVHRDIKPRNIMMEAGHAVIADFGIALQLDAPQADRLTSPGVSPGTPHYMSPEQLLGERKIDGRSDIYSLGCVLYEMIAGEPPFTGPRVDVIRARKLAGLVPDLRIVRPAVSESLERLTLRCLEVAPADRFRTAAELVDALRAAQDEMVRSTTGSGFRTSTGQEEPALGIRARRWVIRAALGAAAIAALATIIGFLSTRAFDMRMQVPAAYAPSRTDYMTIGLKALVPVAFYYFVAIVAWVLIRQLSRLLAGMARKLTPDLTSTVRSATRRIAPRWHAFWQSASARTAVDAFLAVSIVASLLIVIRFGPLLSTLFTSETGILSCSNRPLHRSLTGWMTVLTMAIGFGWYGVFRWIERYKTDKSGVAIAHWGTGTLIVLLLLVMTLPWRLFWDPDTERILVDGERAYVLVEDPPQLVVYKADAGATDVIDVNGSSTIDRLRVNGYIFEERNAFDSGQARCSSITGPE